ncbi:MAG: hypothetical protein AB1918_11160 [Pseudomonadota bacterium]
MIQVIRTIYDPSIKRGRAELVGRIDKTRPAVDGALRAACSAEELVEIEDFLARRSELLSREATREAALSLAGHMRLAEAYFRDAGDGGDGGEDGGAAAEILAAWDDLKKALHKAGFRKDKHAPRRPRRADGHARQGRV